MIAKIAVSAANFAIDKPYSYTVPEGLHLTAGMRVMVPFGRGNRPSEGVVLSLEEGDESKLKAVSQRLDPESLLSDTMLRLAAFIRERYFCTFYDAIRAMLPAGLWFQTRDSYSLTDDRSWQEKTLRNPHAAAILAFLQEMGGAVEESRLRELAGSEEALEQALSYLLRKKWITGSRSFRQRTRDKQEAVATLAVDAGDALAFAASRPKSALMQKNVLQLLCSIGSASVKEICYFTGAKPGTLKRLEELGYVTLSQREVLRCQDVVPAKLEGELVLNPDQQAVYEGLDDQMAQSQPGVALLHGVTGSGKTAVYVKLIQKILEQGKTAVLLVPEIALTPQLLGLMAAYFGQQVAVLHSSLAAAERYDQWKRVKAGAARVVVGTRSAVFAPCPNLGLVILDEEQEHSYKSENSPRYAAKEVAIWRGARENALVLLGSATPSVETMYHARRGDYSLYTLTQRYNGGRLPKVEIVDMRREVKSGNDLSFSAELQLAMGETAAAGKQTVLFLNRRGNSRALVCVDCGDSPECPRCSARLTYHSANERLMCHYCGHSQSAVSRCPSCSGPMKRVGVGTQKAQQELHRLRPDLTVDRMDADTVSAVNTHEKILEHFQKEKVNVLLGTQMVAKGLNLPDVTLVGVLDADLSLYTDSYRAPETTFNMLTQVVGRAGRGDTPGKAIIQTMAPNHPIIHLAARQDYDGFYQLELPMRQMQLLPPFGDLVTVTFTGQEEAAVLRGAVKFRDTLRQWLLQAGVPEQSCTVLGPAPCPVAKINYNFRYRLTLRCRMDRPLRQLLAQLLRLFLTDRENRGISAFADINGYD